MSSSVPKVNKILSFNGTFPPDTNISPPVLVIPATVVNAPVNLDVPPTLSVLLITDDVEVNSPVVELNVPLLTK